MVTTNPGQPLLPLHQVASGGELSRIALALANANRKHATKPILIFDEVDVGIGGQTAQIVGHLLHSLSHNAQVLCITHLPQVASRADHHFAVNKSVRNKITTTAIKALDHPGKIAEIARMLGGMTITEQTRKHAAELLAHPIALSIAAYVALFTQILTCRDQFPYVPRLVRGIQKAKLWLVNSLEVLLSIPGCRGQAAARRKMESRHVDRKR